MAAIKKRVTVADGHTNISGKRYFMSNGGCFYFEKLPNSVDGGLIEFATPECISASQVLAFKRAQFLLLTRCIDEVEQALTDLDYRGNLKILKNSRDVHGNTYGEQENYEIQASTATRLFVYRALLTTLAVLVSPLYLVFIVVMFASILLFLPFAIISILVKVVKNLDLPDHEIDRQSSNILLPLMKLLVFAEVKLLAPVFTVISHIAEFAFVRPFRQKLAAHLISRCIYAGSGSVHQRHFYISEKALSVNVAIRRTSNLGHRAIFETSNFYKAFLNLFFIAWNADATQIFNRTQRLQIGFSDAGISQVADYLNLATTDLIVRMISEGLLDDAPVIHDPIAALRKIIEDPELQNKVNTSQGYLSALDIQQYYLDETKRYVHDRKIIEPELIDLVALWEKVLHGLNGDPGHLIGQIDWLNKLYLLKRSGFPLNSAEAKKIDLKYHELGSGYYSKLQEQGLTTELISERQIEDAISAPPRTRAAVRSRLMRELLSRPGKITVSWGTVKFKTSLLSKAEVVDLADYREADSRSMKGGE